MNDAAALDFLNEVVGLMNESRLIYDGSRSDYWEHPRWPQLQEQIFASIPGVCRIAAAMSTVTPATFESQPGQYSWEWDEARNAMYQLRGAIEQDERISGIVEFAGPQLAASQLHEWVWLPVSSLWAGGHYRSALQMAATSVSGQLQAKLGRYDLADSDLVTQAFGDADPSPTDPRLRFENHAPGSRTYRSAYEGAKLFGRGCMLAIRNLAVHDIAEVDEQDALEQLAALSVLARWIDAATVVTG